MPVYVFKCAVCGAVFEKRCQVNDDLSGFVCPNNHNNIRRVYSSPYVIFKGSVGRTDFEGSDHNQLINSIQEKLLPLGSDVTFIPGHGPSSTFGEERLSNPFLLDNPG